MTASSALLKDLTDPQREAVTHVTGPLLVVAGPGSGKTRVITRRVAHLVNEGVPPSAILAITFTNKAAAEMKRRIHELCDARGAWIRTFHSTCALILREFPSAAGLEPGFSIFDTQDQKRIINAALKTRGVDKAVLKPAAARSAISRWKGEGTDPEVALREAWHETARASAHIYADYEAALRNNNAVDFDDLLLRTANALEEDEAVRRIMQARFGFVMIDEYQDTSPVQFRLASHFAKRTGNICATGDPDQSIYAFRNADLRNILEFEKRYPGAKVIRLEQNFRSVGNVLKAADALISNNRDRRKKRLFTEAEDGEKILLRTAWSEREEGLSIADGLLEAYSRGTPYNDMAVFYRVNAQSRALEAGLRSRGIPYQIIKGTEFYQRAEVKDLIAYMKVTANPRDWASMERVLSTPTKGIGAVSIGKLKALAAEAGLSARESLMQAVERGAIGKRQCAQLRILSEALDGLSRLAKDGPVAPLLTEAVRATAYEKHLKSQYGEDHETRLENVRELIGAAAEYDEDLGDAGSLIGFLLHVGLVSDSDRYDIDAPRVPLMTLHTAKGLEFAEVFIAGIEEGLLPHSRSTDDPKALEEERRLLFVGLTRAKRRLTLGYAAHRQARIVMNAGGPSRFLAELPPEIVDVDCSTGPAAVQQDLGGAPSWADRGGGSRRSEAPPRRRWGQRKTEDWHGIDAAPDYSSDAGQGHDGVDEPSRVPIRPGMRVKHGKFGTGQVLRMSGQGIRAKAVIRFRGFGEKTLMLEHAKLVPVDM